MTTAPTQPPAHNITDTLRTALKQRILMLDGAMGTMIQQYPLSETDFRGQRFSDWPTDLKGNNDLLVLTRPDIIREIHGAFLDAGCDIIETNTFNATSIAMADYDMAHLSKEINFQAAKLARKLRSSSAQRNSRAMLLAYSARPTVPAHCHRM